MNSAEFEVVLKKMIGPNKMRQKLVGNRKFQNIKFIRLKICATEFMLIISHITN